MKTISLSIILIYVTLLIISCNSIENKIIENNVISTAHPLASLAGKQMFEQNTKTRTS